MTLNRRNPFLLILITLFIVTAKNAVAQYPGMGAFRARMALQDANQHMTQMMQAMNWRTNAGEGNTYQVKFKDSTVKQVVSYLYTDNVLHKTFLLSVDKKYKKSDSAHRYQKIYPDQTLFISAGSDYRTKRELIGIPLDSCWQFKAINGPISVYAKYQEITKEDFNPLNVIAIQLNGGAMVKYNVENLKQMVSQDIDALEEIQKKNHYKAVIKYNRNAEKAAKK